MRGSLLIAALGSALAACTSQPAVDIEAARAALRDADSRYSQAAVGKDRAAFVAFYAPDAVMYPPGEATVSGLDGIGKLADTFWRDPAFAGSFRPIAVEVANDGTMGYTLNAAELTVTGPDGKPTTERLRDFHIWRRQPDGSWKLTVDIWNAEPSAAGAAKD
jgi:uncharacterized protein (TIGR02246 family)